MGWPSALKQRRTKKRIEKALGRFDLPPFPKVVQELMALLRDSSSSATKLSQLIEIDPALSMATLRLANSAAFASSRRVVDARQAVVLLGRASLESVVVEVGVKRAMSGAGSAEQLARFWSAATARAAIARALSSKLDPGLAQLSYTAGLLADAAVPFLRQAFPEADGGHDHAQVGSWMCTVWALPDALAEAVQHHHCDGQHDEPCPAPLGLRLASAVDENLPLEPPAACAEALVDQVVAYSPIDVAGARSLIVGALEPGVTQS